MFKRIAPILLLGWVAAIPSGRSIPPSGSWQVDNGHSDARFTVDGTTDSGKTPTTFTVGFTRAIGQVTLDKTDPAKSAIDFKLYPAGSMTPVIDEDGQVKRSWLISMANHTLICFSSKSVSAIGEDQLKTDGILTLTRVDRNVEITSGEGYSGPVYGAPIIHRISREATFVFRVPPVSGSGDLMLTGSSRVNREDFPQLVKSVLSTYWPPVVEDKKCEVPSGIGDDYAGVKCTGTVVDDGSSMPQSPAASGGREDYPGPANFNSIVGNHVDLRVHLTLKPAAAQSAKAGQ